MGTLGRVGVPQVTVLQGSQETSAWAAQSLAESSVLNRRDVLENLPPFHSRQIDSVGSVVGDTTVFSMDDHYGDK